MNETSPTDPTPRADAAARPDATNDPSSVYVVMQKRHDGTVEIGAIFASERSAEAKVFDRKTKAYGSTIEPFVDAWMEPWHVQGRRPAALTTPPPPPTGPWTDAQIEAAYSEFKDRWGALPDEDGETMTDWDFADPAHIKGILRAVLDAVARVPVTPPPVPVVADAMVEAAARVGFEDKVQTRGMDLNRYEWDAVKDDPRWEEVVAHWRDRAGLMLTAALAVAAGGSDDDDQ